MTFEEWLKDSGIPDAPTWQEIWDAAYLAGVEAERKRCVGVARNFKSDNPALVIGYGLLAAAIEGRK